MTLYFTSDQHFGHRNIIEYAGRPFSDVDRMRHHLVREWNAEVTAEDDVWVLGDFALGRLDDSLTVLGELNGHKFLLPGNHDRCWQGHRKGKDQRQRYLDAGFEAILDEPLTLDIAGERVLISHFPYRGTGDHPGIEERYREHKPVNKGWWLLHGHVHERWRVRGRQINVGVDAWGGHLLDLAHVEYQISCGPRHRSPYEWSWAANLDDDELAAEMARIHALMGDMDRSLGKFDKRASRSE